MAFIQLLKCEETERLLKDHTNEFLLLTLIAYRARRTAIPSPGGLQIGQALIGDYKSCGLTNQKYRTALKNLEKWQFLTIKPTNKGTVVTLLDSNVFNINKQSANEQNNNQPTNNQRTTNKQLTTNNKIIRQEDKKESKKKCADFVEMTEKEHGALVERFGESVAADWIESLNLWKGSKGKKTKSDYLTILNWDRMKKDNNTTGRREDLNY